MQDLHLLMYGQQCWRPIYRQPSRSFFLVQEKGAFIMALVQKEEARPRGKAKGSCRKPQDVRSEQEAPRVSPGLPGLQIIDQGAAGEVRVNFQRYECQQ